MNKEEFTIRRANYQDAKGIHLAHMRSIQEICSKDHSAAEIQARGTRPYPEDIRLNAIKNDFVWIIEHDNSIQGYGHLGIYEKDNINYGHILGLYLTPLTKGKSFGKNIFDKMMEVCKSKMIKVITLESTITAHKFYLSLGFVNNGPEISIKINETPVRCYPMKMEL